jgi:putative sterol carrier protein
MAKAMKAREFARLKDLRAGGKGDSEGTLHTFGKLLESSGLEAVVQFDLAHSGGVKTFAVSVQKGGSSVKQGAATRPHLRIGLDEAAWQEIASGATAPLDVFVRGKLRVQGDTQLAVKIIHHLAGTAGRVDVC